MSGAAQDLGAIFQAVGSSKTKTIGHDLPDQLDRLSQWPWLDLGLQS